jgi:hypothetical protein
MVGEWGRMPIYPNAVPLIRANLKLIRSGQRVKPVVVGILTNLQLDGINQHRLSRNHLLLPIVAEVIFLGNHIYQSRIKRDGYSIEDIVDQIVSAMDEDSELVGSLPMQASENPNARHDRYGNEIHDRAVFECMSRHPRPELFSVVPKGDKIKPPKQKGCP